MVAPDAVTFEWAGAKLVLPEAAKIVQLHPDNIFPTINNMVMRYRNFTTASSIQYQPAAGKKFVLLGVEELVMSTTTNPGPDMQIGITDLATGTPPSSGDRLSFILPYGRKEISYEGSHVVTESMLLQYWFGDVDLELTPGNYLYSRAFRSGSSFPRYATTSRMIGYEVDDE